MASCRSSGVLTASSVISSGRCKLMSIHIQNTGAGAPTTIKVFDNTAASGKELLRVITEPNASAIEFDMHGVIASVGLYLEISTGSGTGAAVSVEFA
tara:strand:- start:773 stop:1063 length:291 start_codon:yes stop_codon:yes gene_type:complete